DEPQGYMAQLPALFERASADSTVADIVRVDRCHCGVLPGCQRQRDTSRPGPDRRRGCLHPSQVNSGLSPVTAIASAPAICSQASTYPPQSCSPLENDM